MFQGNWLWRPQASGPIFAHSWFHLILIERFGARDNNAIVLQPRLIRLVQCCHVFIPPVGGDHHFDAVEPHFVWKHVCSTVSKRHFLGGALKKFVVLGHSHRRAFVKDDAFMHQRVEVTQVGLFSRATIHHESLGGARQGTSKNCFAHTQWPSENQKLAWLASARGAKRLLLLSSALQWHDLLRIGHDSQHSQDNSECVSWHERTPLWRWRMQSFGLPMSWSPTLGSVGRRDKQGNWWPSG